MYVQRLKGADSYRRACIGYIEHVFFFIRPAPHLLPHPYLGKESPPTRENAGEGLRRDLGRVRGKKRGGSGGPTASDGREINTGSW